jgi:xanthosine utilization system XapX-like protein
MRAFMFVYGHLVVLTIALVGVVLIVWGCQILAWVWKVYPLMWRGTP